jgi:hypothetical protein
VCPRAGWSSGRSLPEPRLLFSKIGTTRRKFSGWRSPRTGHYPIFSTFCRSRHLPRRAASHSGCGWSSSGQLRLSSATSVSSDHGRRGGSRSRIQHRPGSPASRLRERGGRRTGDLGARSARRPDNRRSLRRRQRGIDPHPRPRWVPSDGGSGRTCSLGVHRGVHAPLIERHCRTLGQASVPFPG